MTLKEAREIEATLKPCKCGGQLCLGVGAQPKKGISHFTMICRNCGAWCGGITRKKEASNENN